MIKIVIIDDHPLMRKGLAMSLESEADIRVAAQAASAEDGLGIIEAEDPDLVVVDISLPGMSGIELVKQVQAIRPEMKTLVVSRHDEALYAERAIRAGAKGYVMKLEAPDVMIKAVRRVMNGGIYVSEKVNERLLWMCSAIESLRCLN
jgi:DNA-binding NarL/FixJ family response regulator